MKKELTDRQRRELEYHSKHAEEKKRILTLPFSWDVLSDPRRRWWNAYWQMYAYLTSCDLRDKRVLIVGCGFGDDALRIAKLGAQVSAFDLSPEALDIASRLASREGLTIDFDQMPAEDLTYPDSSFDFIVARDILHHVNIPLAMAELCRVAKPNAMLVVNEIYSHTLTYRIRNSKFIEKFIYPKISKIIYGTASPYITEDERKLSEKDIEEIILPLKNPEYIRYFNFLTSRIVPDRFATFAKMDYLMLRLLKPFGSVLGGRILFCAKVSK